MSLGANSVNLAGSAGPQFGNDDEADDRSISSFGGGAADQRSATVVVPGVANSDTESLQQTAGFNLMRLTPPPPINDILVQGPAEILVLDEVGVCEDESPNIETGVNPGPDVMNHIQPEVDVKLGALNSPVSGGNKLSTELNDDILSIMCDDNEDDDFYGGDTSKKRDWSSVSRFSSKRKQDSADVPKSAKKKKSRSMPKTPTPRNGKTRAGSFQDRLGRPKYSQDQTDCELQRPCFNFVKNGNCFRPSCPFLHPCPPHQDNGAARNRHRRMSNGDVILGNSPPRYLVELQQKVLQQEAEQQSLMQHVKRTEMQLKQYAAHQARQVYDHMQEMLHSQQQQQQDELHQTKQMYRQLSLDRGKMEEQARVLESLCRLLQLVLEHHLQNFKPDRSAAPQSTKVSTRLHLLPDLRQIPPLKKFDADRPPRPRSADFDNQRSLARDAWPPLSVRPEESQCRPLSADNLRRTDRLPYHAHRSLQESMPLHRSHECQNVASLNHDWYIGPTYHSGQLMHDLQVPASQPHCHAAGNPRVVRVVPVQHCAETTFEAYAHEHAPLPPQ
ncbi:uncharacterized protein LOC110979961 isoform X2 [Acanthaster planci]|uniref:Uncharacterized protein LOC110979961 isoform X2 n=1 Tax=Acanthaster planci TaxID=133434 RepID=A0A8B7YH05_ACAPL|nr:uncharacterized protein LOC110979961 isoform X2 [Acanthaster planci]